MRLPPPDRDPYSAWRGALAGPDFARDDTALLVIDMQYLDADWDSGMCLRARQEGFETDLLYYRDRLGDIIPNIRLLQDSFREKEAEVIFATIASLTTDGRDRGAGHKSLGMHAPPGSREAEILDELKPVGDEIVLTKTTSSIFNGTAIERVLRNLGINNLIFSGVFTTNCVESSVRDASDLGFDCSVVEDACGALIEEMHVASIRALRNVYARVMTTGEVVEIIQGL